MGSRADRRMGLRDLLVYLRERFDFYRWAAVRIDP